MLFSQPVPKSKSRTNCRSTLNVFVLVTSTDIDLVKANQGAKPT